MKRENSYDKVKDIQLLHRQRNRINVIKYLQNHPCSDCGETDPRVLDFDHVGVKSKDISRMITGGHYSWNRILLEIGQCEVRCANCHRKKTIGEPEWFKNFQLFEQKTIEATKKLGKPTRGTIRHGTSVGYSYWKCRCDLCRNAHRERHKKWRNKLS